MTIHIAPDGTVYRLRSWEERAAPGEALAVAIGWAYVEGVEVVGVEITGADLSGRSVEESWRKVFDGAVTQVLAEHPEWAGLPRPRMTRLKVTSSQGSKQARGSQMHADYERPGRIVHVVGDHTTLEAALARAFVVKPFDLADAAYWAWADLRGRGQGVAVSAAAREI